jgi:hypothetical protein
MAIAVAKRQYYPASTLLGFGVYFSYLLFQAMNRNQWSMIPFVLIFQVGFLYVGLMSVAQTSFQLFRQTHQTALSAAGA